MTSDETLLLALLRATPEERESFWKNLQNMAEKNGMSPGFYHPYIPLQIYGVSDTKPKRFQDYIVRADLNKKDDDEQGSVS
jgi:hypothetical protein